MQNWTATGMGKAMGMLALGAMVLVAPVAARAETAA